MLRGFILYFPEGSLRLPYRCFPALVFLPGLLPPATTREPVSTPEDCAMTATRWTRFGTSALLALGAALINAPSTPAAVTLPGNNQVEKVDFERHVMGLFGRMGCN